MKDHSDQLHQRGEILEIVKALTEQLPALASLSANLPTENAGRSGWVRIELSFFSIKTTEDMVGLSQGSS
jgi:hypothetical protein